MNVIQAVTVVLLILTFVMLVLTAYFNLVTRRNLRRLRRMRENK